MDLEDDAVVEYVPESLDSDAPGLDAFSDVFKRFKAVVDDEPVRLFSAPSSCYTMKFTMHSPRMAQLVQTRAR